MIAGETDTFWRRVGESDPYWGVVTDDRFHDRNLTDETLDEFYATGEAHVDVVFETIRTRLVPEFAPRSALDFGCGVGRIVAPLAKRCGQVVGVDVSEGMLRRAQARTDRLGLTNVRFHESDDELTAVRESFDLVHCYIVLQHVESTRGTAIARQLLARLNDGGVGALHFLYFKQTARPASPLRTAVGRAARTIGAHRLYCLARDAVRGGRTPQHMQMNCYDMNAVLRMLQDAGVRRLHVELSDHGECYGAMLFFQKSAGARYVL